MVYSTFYDGTIKSNCVLLSCHDAFQSESTLQSFRKTGAISEV